jgi:Protein of unknown function (DUF1778)
MNTLTTQTSAQSLKLNIEDSKAFVKAILNPPKPNDALKLAALRYKIGNCSTRVRGKKEKKEEIRHF